MKIFKADTDKEFHCRKCGSFLDNTDLKDGKCPTCDSDEEVFINQED
jgi:rubrerythrin